MREARLPLHRLLGRIHQQCVSENRGLEDHLNSVWLEPKDGLKDLD